MTVTERVPAAPRVPARRVEHLLTRTPAGPASVAGLTAGALLLLHQVDPGEPGHYPSCPFLLVTGWYCPGCGSLRMLAALTHGDLDAAVAMNPVGLLLLPVLVWYWLDWTRRVVTGAPRRRTLPGAYVVTFGVLIGTYWVARNLPALQWLAPG